MEDLGKILNENGISNEDLQKATNELNNLNGTNDMNEINNDNLEKVADNLNLNLDGANNDDLQNIANNLQNGQANIPTTGANIPTIGGNPTLSEECLKLNTEYVECFGDPNSVSSNEEICNKINSDKCKSFLNQDFSVCGNELGGLFDFALSIYKLGCAKDENGKSCPQAKIFQDPNADFNDKDIQDICKSNVCTENAVDGFTQLKKSILSTKAEKDSKTFEGYLKTLNECKAVNEQKSSGTTQVKVGSALLATLALAFYLF